jgi:EAL domain-containing protein (putative c-di-GMP-specific phosphodiesterase class I)
MQAALLETSGCRNMQGFLFAPALSPEELVPMLHRALDSL